MGGLTEARQLQPLTTRECLQRLTTVSFGRVAFSMHALPAIRPVNHIIDGDMVVIRTHLGAAVSSAVGQVVAYQADAIDDADHLGWSVVATGIAHTVTDPAELTRLQPMLRPWIDGQRDHVIKIEPQIVNGYQLIRNG